jgi:hypothetical protein
MIGKLPGRIVGTTLACALSLYATGALPPLALADASCCCHRHAENCQCKACTHARGVESGRSQLETCGPSQPVNAVPLPSHVFLPPSDAQQLPRSPGIRVDVAPVPPPLEPVSEVPTPPPLARS